MLQNCVVTAPSMELGDASMILAFKDDTPGIAIQKTLLVCVFYFHRAKKGRKNHGLNLVLFQLSMGDII